MGSLSIDTISASSLSKFRNNAAPSNCFPPKFPRIPLISYPRVLRSSHVSPNFQFKTDFRISVNQLNAFRHFSQPSRASLASCSISSLRSVLKFFAETIVVLLVGSFAFTGLRGNGRVLALPAQTNMEETRTNREFTSEVEDMYVKLAEENPRNVDALKMVVNAKMKNGKTAEALVYVEKLIDIQPREVEWRLLQALCYEMMGQLSKARTLFKDILKRRPLLIRALHGLAIVMHKNHEGPAVFEMLNRALNVASSRKRSTEERNIKILIAQMHVIKGELEEGLTKFQNLVEENPREFRPYLCQGIIYSLLDKKEEASKQFEMYRSLVPEEFPQRGFLDDVVLAAKRESRQKLEKNLGAEFSSNN